MPIRFQPEPADHGWLDITGDSIQLPAGLDVAPGLTVTLAPTLKGEKLHLMLEFYSDLALDGQTSESVEQLDESTEGPELATIAQLSRAKFTFTLAQLAEFSDREEFENFLIDEMCKVLAGPGCDARVTITRRSEPSGIWLDIRVELGRMVDPLLCLDYEMALSCTDGIFKEKVPA